MSVWRLDGIKNKIFQQIAESKLGSAGVVLSSGLGRDSRENQQPWALIIYHFSIETPCYEHAEHRLQL